MSSRLSLQGSNQDTLIQGIPRHNLPVMKHRQTESLSLCVCPQICLESERVNCGNECLDCVQWGTWHWCILGNMTSVTIGLAVLKNIHHYLDLLLSYNIIINFTVE